MSVAILSDGALFLKESIFLRVQFEVCPSESLEYLPEVVGLLLEYPADNYHGFIRVIF
jgi:hypothetical protein